VSGETRRTHGFAVMPRSKTSPQAGMGPAERRLRLAGVVELTADVPIRAVLLNASALRTLSPTTLTNA
jgi:hypothetical protein